MSDVFDAPIPQGGYLILCSYFQGVNIIYGAKSVLRTADEINYRAYDRCYHQVCGYL